MVEISKLTLSVMRWNECIVGALTIGRFVISEVADRYLEKTVISDSVLGKFELAVDLPAGESKYTLFPWTSLEMLLFIPAIKSFYRLKWCSLSLSFSFSSSSSSFNSFLGLFG